MTRVFGIKTNLGPHQFVSSDFTVQVILASDCLAVSTNSSQRRRKEKRISQSSLSKFCIDMFAANIDAYIGRSGKSTGRCGVALRYALCKLRVGEAFYSDTWIRATG